MRLVTYFYGRVSDGFEWWFSLILLHYIRELLEPLPKSTKVAVSQNSYYLLVLIEYGDVEAVSAVVLEVYTIITLI